MREAGWVGPPMPDPALFSYQRGIARVRTSILPVELAIPLLPGSGWLESGLGLGFSSEDGWWLDIVGTWTPVVTGTALGYVNLVNETLGEGVIGWAKDIDYTISLESVERTSLAGSLRASGLLSIERANREVIERTEWIVVQFEAYP